jgi:DNA-binding IclR family transcriptional regulator
MPRPGRAGPPAAIKSAARTLDIFEFFRERQSPATVSEVAAALGIPQSSTSMLLKSLTTLNYLDYRPATRRFAPTFRVTMLGNWIGPRYANEAITAIMERLRHDTGETVFLGMESGPSIQYVHILPGIFPLQLTASVGTIRPMTLSAIGRIILSTKPAAQIRAIVRRNNADAADAEQRVPENEFLDDIEVIRAQGYAESRGRMTPGANVIAMLVPGDDSGPRLGIGIGGPTARLDERRDQIIAVLRRHLGAG